MIHRLILLSLLTVGLVHAEAFKESYAETRPLNPQGKVQIENVNGSILIRTWDRAEVSVRVEKIASSQQYLKAIRVEIKATSNSLSIKTTMPRHEISWHDLIDWSWAKTGSDHVQLVLTVPSGAQLGKIATVNGGITLEGTHGPVDATTINGEIHASGLHGGALETVNGSIHAAIDQLDSNGHLAVSTVNGSVEILLPKDVGANVRVSTVNGHISCDFPTEAKRGIIGSNLTGVIGAGGGSIKISSVNGAVSLQSL